MNRSDRLALISSTLSAIPLYISIGLGLPAKVQKALIKITNVFLWTGSNMMQANKCLVAWPGVQRLLEVGDSGVLDQKLFGIALRLRWLWLSWTDSSRAWSAMPMHADPCTSAFFDISLSVAIGDGKSTLFWKDRWLDSKCVADLAPGLVAAVPKCRWNSATVACALPNHAWIRDVSGALIVPDLMQYVPWKRLDNWGLQPDVSDRFVWRWCSSGSY
jgi:hypothetical protein